MANATDPLARQIHSTNPQNLIEKILRLRIYSNQYWKEHCFGLTAESLIDKAVKLDYIGGTYSHNSKPTPFICLVLKLLQIQPDKDIIIEYIKQEDYKYLRALGAFYLRITGRAVDVYSYLEPLYNDYRKLAFRSPSGWRLMHMDELIDELLSSENCCDVALPFLQKRDVLVTTSQLQPRVSALEDDLEEGEDGGHMLVDNGATSSTGPLRLDDEDNDQAVAAGGMDVEDGEDFTTGGPDALLRQATAAAARDEASSSDDDVEDVDAAQATSAAARAASSSSMKHGDGADQDEDMEQQQHRQQGPSTSSRQHQARKPSTSDAVAAAPQSQRGRSSSRSPRPPARDVRGAAQSQPAAGAAGGVGRAYGAERDRLMDEDAHYKRHDDDGGRGGRRPRSRSRSAADRSRRHDRSRGEHRDARRRSPSRSRSRSRSVDSLGRAIDRKPSAADEEGSDKVKPTRSKASSRSRSTSARDRHRRHRGSRSRSRSRHRHRDDRRRHSSRSRSRDRRRDRRSSSRDRYRRDRDVSRDGDRYRRSRSRSSSSHRDQDRDRRRGSGGGCDRRDEADSRRRVDRDRGHHEESRKAGRSGSPVEPHGDSRREPAGGGSRPEESSAPKRSRWGDDRRAPAAAPPTSAPAPAAPPAAIPAPMAAVLEGARRDIRPAWMTQGQAAATAVTAGPAAASAAAPSRPPAAAAPPSIQPEGARRDIRPAWLKQQQQEQHQPTASAGNGGGGKGGGHAEGSVEWWNIERAKLGLKPLK